MLFKVKSNWEGHLPKFNIQSGIWAEQSTKSGFAEAAELILETGFSLETSDSSFQIEEMAEEAARVIKSSLKDRIEMLKKKGHHRLLKDLYCAAIRATLMHKPTIFPSDKSTRMISEGFAVLDTTESGHIIYAPKQSLSEPIVVEAVIEYLHDEKREDEDALENVLRDFLFDNQDDASAFGKAMEFYFAWSLGGLFSQSSYGLGISQKARGNFQEAIGQTNFIPRDNHDSSRFLKEIQGYGEYILEEPTPDLESDLTLGTTITFSEWLHRVEHGIFFPTFHFPSTFAGPDIVFSLRSQKTNERILCAFQVKTGANCGKSDTFQLIHTLDPKLWFWNAPNLSDTLVDSLKPWQFHRILTALVITSHSSIDFFAAKSDLLNGMKALQPYIRDWELCRRLYHSKVYKELTQLVDKFKNGVSLPDDTASILQRAERLAKAFCENNKGPIDYNFTTFAKAQALVKAVEEALKTLLEAANSIYKPRSERQEESPDDKDVPMPDCDNDSVLDDYAANGYYFAILDDIALESFLGPTFYHLCKAMKDVGAAKEKKRTKEAMAVQNQDLRCPISGCERNRKPYRYKGYLETHMEKEHPEYQGGAETS